MSTVQPVLGGGKGVASDLQIVLSESSDCILVFLGTAVLERIRCSREALQYKMLIGRLVNAGWSLTELRTTFGHDPRTMKRWAAALLSDDVEFVVRAFSGRGAEGKLTPALVRYVQGRYAELRGSVRNYQQVIAADVLDLFGERLSGETLRVLFRAADEKAAAGDEMGGGDGPAAGDDAGHDPGGANGGTPGGSTGGGDGPATGGPEGHDADGDGDLDATAGGSLGAGVGGGSEMATGCAPDPRPSVAGTGSPNQSPSPVEPLPPFWQGPEPGRPMGLHHAGMVLFVALLIEFSRWRPDAIGLPTQWLGQVLQGAVNLEQARLISVADLGRFTGPVRAGIQAQQRALAEVASRAAVMAVYAANARLLADGPGRGRVFYYDPHAKEYTGELKLLKGWCGGRHGITKVLYIDLLHTRSGRPCFAQHYSAYYDLRRRVPMTVTLFDELFPPTARQGRLFILDRGIYGLEAFKWFTNDYVLTWEKGYQGDGWEGQQPTVKFSRDRVRNHAGDLRHYHFECREEPWSRLPTMRRILVRATNPKNRTIAVSVLCNDPQLSLEDATWLIFNRWLQENDFKYLDRHFGLNQLTSRAAKAAAEEAGQLADMPVDSPEYRDLKDQHRLVEHDLARELVIREKAHDALKAATARLADLERTTADLVQRSLDLLRGLDQAASPALGPTLDHSEEQRRALAAHGQQLKSTRRAAARSRERLQASEERLPPLKQRLAELEQQLTVAIRHQSRLQLLIDHHYQFLDTRAKSYFDALRLTAANMFADLLRQFRPLYNNYRNDHVMLRNLTRADGFLHREGDTLHVRLWLKGRFQPRQLKVFRRFLATMSEHLTAQRPPGAPAVRITLLDTRPTL